MAADEGARQGQLFGPGFELARRARAAAQPRARQQRVALVERRRVARQIVARSGTEAQDQPIQETTANGGGAGQELPVLRSQEDRGRERGDLPEARRLVSTAELPPGLTRPAHVDALLPPVALEHARDREALPVERHVGGSCAPKRPLSTEERQTLEQVGLALRVLARDERDPGAKGDGVGGQVSEAAAGKFGKLQGFPSDQRRIGMTT